MDHSYLKLEGIGVEGFRLMPKTKEQQQRHASHVTEASHPSSSGFLGVNQIIWLLLPGAT